MKYRINRNFADNYKGKDGERLIIELGHVLYKRDFEDDLVKVRDGKALDIDGIISILLEYGALEKVDKEGDDDDLATAMRMIMGRAGQVRNYTVEKIASKEQDSDKEEAEDPVGNAIRLLLDNGYAVSAPRDNKPCEKKRTLPPLDEVCVTINGFKKFYFFQRSLVDHSIGKSPTQESLLMQSLWSIKNEYRDIEDPFKFVKQITESILIKIEMDAFLNSQKKDKIHYLELLRDKINQEIVQLINSNKNHEDKKYKEDITFEGLTSNQFDLMKNRLKHYEKIINQINSERDDLLHMLKSPYYTCVK